MWLAIEIQPLWHVEQNELLEQSVTGIRSDGAV
jgi:hypothetical protein